MNLIIFSSFNLQGLSFAILYRSFTEINCINQRTKILSAGEKITPPNFLVLEKDKNCGKLAFLSNIPFFNQSDLFCWVFETFFCKLCYLEVSFVNSTVWRESSVVGSIVSLLAYQCSITYVQKRRQLEIDFIDWLNVIIMNDFFYRFCWDVFMIDFWRHDVLIQF